MIYKPFRSMARDFTEKLRHQAGDTRISDLVEALKQDAEIREGLGEWGLAHVTAEAVYVMHRDFMLRFREDKTVSEVFRDFETDRLELAYFLAAGGASIHNETHYRFTLHPDERVHEHTPHVHVKKAGVEIRYSLEDLMPMDPLVNPHKRDDKKIIRPFLKKNQEMLLEMWRYNAKGYAAPEMNENGQQFYRES